MLSPRLSALLLAVLATGAAQAETLFSCTTTQGKQLQIEAQGDSLHYRYGKTGKPELEFSQPRQNINNGACSSEGKRHDWLVMTHNGNEYMIMAEGGQRQRATLDVYLNARKNSSLTLTCRSNSIHNRLSQLSSISSPCSP